MRRSLDHRQPSGNDTFGLALRTWRNHRGLSQLDLALEAGVSSRHLSFLETGRSKPSPEMVLTLLNALEVPLRVRNRFLQAAGYAPAYTRSDLGAEQMEQVRRAVGHLLQGQEPYPAYAMDSGWNVVMANRGFYRSLQGEGIDGERINILDLFFSPRLIRPLVVDWEAPARAVLARVARALDSPDPPPGLVEAVERIRDYPGVSDLMATPFHPAAFDLFVPISVRTGDTILRWMSTIITFGGALDVTLEELVVECFFPADDQTANFFREGSDAG